MAHAYGDIYLSDNARTFLGDQYVSNVYYVAENFSNPESRRATILSALAYMDMNLRRNQLASQKIQHLEWIWGSTTPEMPLQGMLETSPDAGDDASGAGEIRRCRYRLAQLWGFDVENVEIWNAIKKVAGLGRLETFAEPIKPGFVEWLQSDKPLFWIYGKPASGKSSLMKYLSEHDNCKAILKSHLDVEWHLLYFFFDYRAHAGTANSIEGLFRSLLFQLTDRLLTSNVHLMKIPALRDIDVKHNHMSVEDLVNSFRTCVSTARAYLCIFVDGLDEFEGSYFDLSDTLSAIADGITVKMCLASRPEPELVRALHHLPSLKIDQYNHRTIVRYAHMTLQRVARDALAPNELWMLVSHVVSGAIGVIIWCCLVCADLKQGLLAQETFDELLSRLDMYPRALDDVHSRLITKGDERHVDEVAMLLVLIESHSDQGHLHGVTSTKDLHTACKILRDCHLLPTFPVKDLTESQFRARLLSRMGGLVDLLENFTEKRVRLIHKTLSAFLAKTNCLDSPRMAAFRAKFPDRVWLRMYCEYVLHRAQEALPRRTRDSVKEDRAAIELSTAPNLSHKQPAEVKDENETQDDSLSVETGSYRLLTYAISMAIESACVTMIKNGDLASPSRTRPVLPCSDTEDTFTLLRNVLVSESLRLPGVEAASVYCYLPKDMLSKFSSYDLAFYVSLAHGLDPYVEDFHDLATFDKHLKAACGHALASWYTSQRLPMSLHLLDYCLEKFATEINVTQLFAQVGGWMNSYPCNQVISRLLAFRHRKLPPASVTMRKHDLEHIAFVAVDKPQLNTCVRGIVQYWSVVFEKPVPEWFDTFGVTRMFLISVFWIVETTVNSTTTTDDVAIFIAWIELAMVSGEDLNSSCYPNGTLLHLVVECFPPTKILPIAKALIERGLDASICRPKGTALEMLRTWPQNRSNLLKPRLELCSKSRISSSERAPQDAVVRDLITLVENAMRNVKVNAEQAILKPSLEDLLENFPRYSKSGILLSRSFSAHGFTFEYRATLSLPALTSEGCGAAEHSCRSMCHSAER